MYKQLYDEVICNDEILIEKTKQLVEADKHIKTTYIEPKQDYTKDIVIMERFKRQRRELEKR